MSEGAREGGAAKGGEGGNKKQSNAQSPSLALLCEGVGYSRGTRREKGREARGRAQGRGQRGTLAA